MTYSCRPDNGGSLHHRNGNDTVTIFYLWDIKKNGRLIHRAGDREVVYKKDVKFDFDIDEMQFS